MKQPARTVRRSRGVIVGLAVCVAVLAGCSSDEVWSIDAEDEIAGLAVDADHVFFSPGREHGLDDRRPIIVLDASTGDPLGSVGDPVLRYEMEPVAGGVVAARDREVCRFDAGGTQRWCTDVGPMPDDPAIEGSFPRRSHLAIDGDTVIASAWDSPLTGLDLATGEPRWTQDDVVTLQPAFLTASDGLVAVREVLDGELLIVQAVDGDVRWRQPLESAGQEFLYPRTWIDGTVVVATEGPRVMAYDRDTGDLTWEQRFEDVAVPTGAPIVLDDVVVGVWHESAYTDAPAMVIGVDLTTGEQRWSQEVNGLTRSVPHPVALTDLEDGRLLIAGDSLLVVDAGTGEVEVEPFGSRGSAWPVVQVAGDAILIDEDGQLVRVQIPE